MPTSGASRPAATWLLNLAGFNEQIEELGDKMVGMGLALIDLTNFKKVNDEHNHAVGNAVLVDIADVIRASTRKNDHTARIGGDEFLIAIDTRPHGNDRRLGETTPEEQITEVCHRLALFMTDVFTKHEGIGDLGFQMAVGATIWRRGDTLRSAMLRAEEAMKAHKEQQHDELGQYRG